MYRGEGMLKQLRQEKILEILSEKGVVTVNELCTALNTSKATIRRDLLLLDEKDGVKKAYGGVMLINKRATEDLPIELRRTMNKEEKTLIAKAALEYINEGDTIFLDPGTTNFQLACQLNKFENLTVLTNDIDIASEISRNSNHELIIVGGFVKKKTTAITGFFAEQMIQNIHVNIAFLATDSVDLDHGFMCHDMDELPIKRLMIRNSKTKFMLCDHSKFQNAALVSICPVTDVDKIITNDEIDRATLKGLTDAGATVQVV